MCVQQCYSHQRLDNSPGAVAQSTSSISVSTPDIRCSNQDVQVWLHPNLLCLFLSVGVSLCFSGSFCSAAPWPSPRKRIARMLPSTQKMSQRSGSASAQPSLSAKPDSQPWSERAPSFQLSLLRTPAARAHYWTLHAIVSLQNAVSAAMKARLHGHRSGPILLCHGSEGVACSDRKACLDAQQAECVPFLCVSASLNVGFISGRILQQTAAPVQVAEAHM